jgi:hypothetical protein
MKRFLPKLSHVLTALACLGIAAALAAQSITVDKATIGGLVYDVNGAPNPAAGIRGGVKSLSASSHNFLTGLGTDGVLTRAQPAASDVTGLAAVATSGAAADVSGLATVATTGAAADVSGLATVATSGSAADLGTGTLPAARLPNPSATTLGGVQSLTSTSHQFLTSIGTDGVPTKAQPAATDISGLATSATTDTTNAANISSGTLPAGRLPNPAASSLGGVQSYAAVTNQFLTSISTSGVPASAQPSCSTLSNAAASCATDATNASNIGTGTLGSGRLPAFTNHGLLVGTGSAGAPTIVGPSSSGGAALVSNGSSADPSFQYLTALGSVTAPVNGNFSWVNQGSASVSVNSDPSGSILLALPAETSGILRCRFASAPSTPYTITTLIDFSYYPANFALFGEAFRASVGGKIVVAGFIGGATVRSFVIQKWTDASTYSADYLNVSYPAGGNRLYLRITDNGTNRITSYSHDGNAFVTMHTISRTDFLTADQVGFCMQESNNVAGQSMTVYSWLQQ